MEFSNSISPSPGLVRLYAIYRLLLSSLLLGLFQLEFAPSYLGSDNPDLFSITATAL